MNKTFLGPPGTLIKKGGDGEKNTCFLFLITRRVYTKGEEELKYFIQALKKLTTQHNTIKTIAIQEEYTPIWKHKERILSQFEEATKIEVSIYKPLSFELLKTIF